MRKFVTSAVGLVILAGASYGGVAYQIGSEISSGIGIYERRLLEIDGVSVAVPAGTSIMRAAMDMGTRVPKLCATDSLEKFGEGIAVDGRVGERPHHQTLGESHDHDGELFDREWRSCSVFPELEHLGVGAGVGLGDLLVVGL